MAIIMAMVDIPIDITMVIRRTTTIGDEIAHRANDFRLKEGQLMNSRVVII
jgi:hypothetical protein